MAILKKGLRKIVVNGETFYWRIRKKVSHNERCDTEYSVPILHESEGQLLFVYVGFCRSEGYWTEYITSVTPKLIREKIIEAINLGWKYAEKGSAIRLVGQRLIQT